MKTKAIQDVFRVTLKGDEILQEVRQSVRKLASNPRRKTPGFRAGKVPSDVVFGQYQDQVVGQALEKVLQKSLHERVGERLVAQSSLRWTVQPQVSWENAKDAEAEVKIVFVPEFPEIAWDQEKLPTLKAPDSEVVDAFVARYLKQFKRGEPLTEERVSQLGDTLVVQVCVQSDEGEKVSTFRLVLGDDSLAEIDLNDLVGVSKGYEIAQRLKVPHFMSHLPLAGKKVQFTLKVDDIQQTVPCDVDETSALYVARCSLEELKRRAEVFLQQHLQSRGLGLQKAQVEAKIFDLAQDTEVPEEVLKERVEGLRRHYGKAQDFEAQVPEENREAWLLEVAKHLLVKEWFVQDYRRRHPKETTFTQEEVLAGLMVYGRMSGQSREAVVKRFTQDRAFEEFILDWVSSDKVERFIVSQCQLADPSASVPSPWAALPVAQQAYLELSGRKIGAFSVDDYVAEFDVKNVDLTQERGKPVQEEAPASEEEAA